VFMFLGEAALYERAGIPWSPKRTFPVVNLYDSY